jgi:uncharacterized membrane protein
MKFTEGDISVKVMDHVQDFLIEGDILGHCLFASQYHKKIDSLLFSAYFKGELVESVEVSIYSMEISQARGQGNRASKHNKKIVELVNKNMIRIADRNLRKMPKMAKAV